MPETTQKNAMQFIKEVVNNWLQDRAETWAAAIAFNTVFSLSPLLLIAVTIAGFLVGEDAAMTGIMTQLRDTMGPEAAEMAQSALQSTRDEENSTGIVASVISFVVLLFGASRVFVYLQDALNMIWKRVGDEEESTVKEVVRKRILTFSLVVVIGFLLLVSLVMSALLAGFSDTLAQILPLPGYFPLIMNFVVAWAVITLLFAMIYKILPDKDVQWSDVWLGSALTSLVFNIGKVLIGLYLGNSSIASAYGAAGSLVVLLVWVYFSAQILLAGAEFTQVYAKWHGSWKESTPKKSEQKALN